MLKSTKVILYNDHCQAILIVTLQEQHQSESLTYDIITRHDMIGQLQSWSWTDTNTVISDTQRE